MKEKKALFIVTCLQYTKKTLKFSQNNSIYRTEMPNYIKNNRLRRPSVLVSSTNNEIHICTFIFTLYKDKK